MNFISAARDVMKIVHGGDRERIDAEVRTLLAVILRVPTVDRILLAGAVVTCAMRASNALAETTTCRSCDTSSDEID